eukprot:gene15019-16569_t
MEIWNIITFIVILCNICLCEETKTEKPIRSPTRVFTTDEGNTRAYVYDGIFGKRLLKVMAEMVSSSLTWTFNYPDTYHGVEEMESDGELHWKAPISPGAFANSLIWKAVSKGLRGTGVMDGKQFFPHEVNGVMLMRGFSPAVYKGSGEGDLFMRIFLNKGMKKNDYSELLLYNKKEETFGFVHPKYGRLVVWNDTADFVFKPPCMFYEQAEYSLLIRVTTNEEKFKESQRTFDEFVAKQLANKKEPFPSTNVTDDDISKIDCSKHLTRKFTDSFGQMVAVFDNVVPEEELLALRSFFMNKNSAYTYGSYDPEKSEQHDNVNWIVKLSPTKALDSRVWKYVKHVVSYLSNETTWFPYDVAMNIIQHTHNPRIHTDASPNEHEYTFLMYLSPGWNKEMYGETIFLERDSNQKRVKPGLERFETLKAVVPRFGRIVVFRNIIEHSARPPSPDFLAARYTFACKVGRSPEIARAKAIREIIDIFADSDRAAKKFQDEIYDGKYDTINDEENDRFLREQFEIYEKRSVEDKMQNRQRFLKMLKLKQTIL